MIHVYLEGLHSHRTPLSYAALAPHFEGQIQRVATPEAADLLIYGHILDIAHISDAAMAQWRARRLPVLWLSEEPFWDTIWGPDPLAPRIWVDTRLGRLPVTQINHQTSDLYVWDTLPYYPLTHVRFEAAYGAMFARNATRRPADWQASFAKPAPMPVFMFERRPEPYHDVAWPQVGLHGLCAWRTQVAEALPQARKIGASWGAGPSRFALADWHGDKLAQLDGQAPMIAAFENTHQPEYLTEKLFDAFACGGLPLYVAAPDHGVHRLGLPPSSWLNLWGLSAEVAAQKIANWRPDASFFEAYTRAQHVLATRLSPPKVWTQARRRFAARLCMTLADLHSGHVVERI